MDARLPLLDGGLPGGSHLLTPLRGTRDLETAWTGRCQFLFLEFLIRTVQCGRCWPLVLLSTSNVANAPEELHLFYFQ